MSVTTIAIAVFDYIALWYLLIKELQGKKVEVKNSFSYFLLFLCLVILSSVIETLIKKGG